MEEIDKLLEEFKTKAEIALAKQQEDYPTFRDMEVEFCNLINEGNAICKLILQHPECCDNSTYLILSKTVSFLSVDKIRGKYSDLELIPLVCKKLLDAYKSRLVQLEKEENYPEVININEQLYYFSKNYIYRKNIADILYQKYKNFKQAMEIYQEIEKEQPDNAEYWNNYAELNAEYENLEKRDYCLIQKEISENKLLVKQLLKNEKYDEAIKQNEKLFELTKDYKYKLDIANIIAVCKQDVGKAIKIYKEYEIPKSKDKNYWYQLSDLYMHKNNYYKQVLCIQKAINLELEEPEEASKAGT